MKRRIPQIDKFDDALAAIQSRFPSLLCGVEREHDQLEALAEFPRQRGVDFVVSINLQNSDELHLVASHLSVEWFPCSDGAVLKEFVDSVAGLLSGSYRIVERFILGRAVSARLQKPLDDSEWQTVATWSNLGVLIPWKRTTRVVRNTQQLWATRPE